MMPTPKPVAVGQAGRDRRTAQVLAAQVHLLFGNIRITVGVSVIAATILAWAQRPPRIIPPTRSTRKS